MNQIIKDEINGINLSELVTIIIRSVGERTEEVCRKLIIEQGIHQSNVLIIHEAPFSKAMKTAFEIGIERAKPWTFCVDADVLLRPNSIRQMLTYALKQKRHVCEIQGQVLDKFFNSVRSAGNHLYRTELLDKVIEKIPAEGVDIRPETYTLNRMAESGYPWVKVPLIVGLHDYEQYHRDIYRKCFVQSHKHSNHIDQFLQLWRKKAGNDEDYVTALSGLAYGIEYSGDVYIDVRDVNLEKSFQKKGLIEKSEIILGEWSSDRVEHEIVNWFDTNNSPKHAGKFSIYQRFNRNRKKDGLIEIYAISKRWILNRLGAIIESFGKKIKQD